MGSTWRRRRLRCGVGVGVTDNTTRIEDEIGAIEILINNAGMQHRTPLEDSPEEAWDRLVRTNVTSAFLVGKAMEGTCTNWWRRWCSSPGPAVFCEWSNFVCRWRHDRVDLKGRVGLKPRIAVLGTGLMGGPMARNLLRAGFPVRAWNRTQAKAEVLVSDGATLCQGPAEAVAGAVFIITTLSDRVATGAMIPDADVMDILARGAVWLGMSSTKPEEARAQQDHPVSLGVDHLDAPVSGGTKGAEEGSLAIMAGGDAAAFEGAVPVFEVMGRPVHAGPAGAGQLSKLANQTIVAVTDRSGGRSDASLGKGGANPAVVRDALKGGFADSTILQQHGARMTERNFIPGGLSRFQLKDLDFLLGEAASLGLALPTLQHIRDRFAHFAKRWLAGTRTIRAFTSNFAPATI